MALYRKFRNLLFLCNHTNYTKITQNPPKNSEIVWCTVFAAFLDVARRWGFWYNFVGLQSKLLCCLENTQNVFSVNLYTILYIYARVQRGERALAATMVSGYFFRQKICRFTLFFVPLHSQSLIVLWCNGSTTGFGSVCGGSNPPRTTKICYGWKRCSSRTYRDQHRFLCVYTCFPVPPVLNSQHNVVG